jgi:hypothetical protein
VRPARVASATFSTRAPCSDHRVRRMPAVLPRRVVVARRWSAPTGRFARRRRAAYEIAPTTQAAA